MQLPTNPKNCKNRIINGELQRLCSNCNCWKPANTEYFHFSTSTLARRCKTCANKLAREKARIRRQKSPRETTVVKPKPYKYNAHGHLIEEKLTPAQIKARRNAWVDVLGMGMWTGARYHASVAHSMTRGRAYRAKRKPTGRVCLPDFNINYSRGIA